jgi:nucleolar protein 56
LVVGMAEAYVLATGVGLALLDGGKYLVLHKPFGKTVSEIASVVRKLQLDVAPQSFLEAFVDEAVSRGFNTLLCMGEKLAREISAAAAGRGCAVRAAEPLQIDFETLLSEADREMYRNLLREVMMEVARQKITEQAGRRDLHIVHAVRAFDDLEKTKNQLFVRVREWYDMHFPELFTIVSEIDTYLRLVSAPLLRDDVEKAREILGSKEAEAVIEAAGRSVGGVLAGRDAENLASLARLGLEVSRQAEKTAQYIRELMSVEAPNISTVAGPVLGSRLIALAGGLERLARLPASTIQVLGAEKALFRFFKTGRGAPKHGVIFQHPLVHSAPRWQRGKIARALAAKISIAARIDYFSKEDRGAVLREQLEKRVEEIKKKYSSPPKPEARRPVRRRRGGR